MVKCCSNWSSCDKQVLKFLVFILMVPLLSSQPDLQGYIHLLLFHSCLPPLHLNLGKDEVNFECYSPSNKTQHSSTVFRLCVGHCCKFFMFTQLFYPCKTIAVELLLQHSFHRWANLAREVNCCVPFSTLDGKLWKHGSEPRIGSRMLLSPLLCSNDFSAAETLQVADTWVRGTSLL